MGWIPDHELSDRTISCHVTTVSNLYCAMLPFGIIWFWSCGTVPVARLRFHEGIFYKILFAPWIFCWLICVCCCWCGAAVTKLTTSFRRTFDWSSPTVSGLTRTTHRLVKPVTRWSSSLSHAGPNWPPPLRPIVCHCRLIVHDAHHALTEYLIDSSLSSFTCLMCVVVVVVVLSWGRSNAMLWVGV